MTARDEPVSYEVRLEVDESVAAEVDAWLPGHVTEMLRLPGFVSAEIYDDAPLPVPPDDKVRRTVRYEIASRDALSGYLRDHAPRMREEGVKLFGDRMLATRRVLQSVNAARTPNERSCSNCHAILAGQYCAVCGQRDRSRMISLWELIVDFAGEFVDLDTRFWRTLFPLMFRPGRLTSEYLRGRRVHYSPPLRMYVISSVLFFLLANLGSMEKDLGFDDDKQQAPTSEDKSSAPDAGETPGDEGAGEHPDTGLPPEALAALAQLGEHHDSVLPPEALEAIAQAKDAAKEGASQTEGVVIGSEKCNLGDFQTGNAFFDGPVRARLQAACKRIAADNGRNFGKQLLANIPKMLFFFLPIIALAMKPLYLRSKRYYVEHLLFFVHVHSFVFTALTVTLVTSALHKVFPGLSIVNGLVIAAVSIYIPYYLFRALRIVYGQGRLMTLFKYVLLFVTYVIGMSITLAIGALFTALTV